MRDQQRRAGCPPSPAALTAGCSTDCGLLKVLEHQLGDEVRGRSASEAEAGQLRDQLRAMQAEPLSPCSIPEETDQATLQREMEQAAGCQDYSRAADYQQKLNKLIDRHKSVNGLLKHQIRATTQDRVKHAGTEKTASFGSNQW